MTQTYKSSGENFPTTIVFILGALVAFGPMSIDMYLPSLPSIGQTFGASPGDVQLTLSAFFIGFSLGQIFYGPLSDRYGRRPILLIGIGLYILTSALCAMSETIDQMIVFRFLHALGGGAGTVVARASVRDRFDTNQASRVMSSMMVVTAIAPLFAPLVGGYILTWFGWRTIFWVLTGFGIVSWLLVALALPESHPKEKRAAGPISGTFNGYLLVLKSPVAVGCILCGGFGFAGMFAYIAGSPFVYIEIFGVSPQEYGYLFGLNIVGMIIGALLNAKIVMRAGAINMMSVGVLLAAVAGLLLVAMAVSGAGGLLGLVLPLLFFVGSLNFIAANAITVASAGFPQNAGAVAALFGAAQFGLGAIASSIVGQLEDGTPIPMAVTIAVCGICALAANLWIRKCEAEVVEGGTASAP